MFLFNGQIISSSQNLENEIIKFEQLNVDLGNLTTSTIKEPKIQETSTKKLLSCFFKKNTDKIFCNENFKKEILPTLNRRIIIPFYIPVLSLICSLLLIKSKKIYFNKFLIFSYSFLLLIFTELAVRYTGLNKHTLLAFLILPFSLLILFYIFLKYKFSKEVKVIMNKIFLNYLLKNFLKTVFIVVLIFYCFGLILNLFEEIEFFKNINVSILTPLILTSIFIPSMIIKILPFIIFISSMWFMLGIRNNKDLLTLKVFGYSNF